MVQFKYLSISRTLCRTVLNSGKSFHRKGQISPMTIRGYYRSTASPFARPTIKGHLQMNRLPNQRLPPEIIETQLGEAQSAELQEKLT